MLPEHMPKSLLVVGSGAIGIASFYRNYASRGARQHCDALGEGELARRDQPTWRAFSMLVPTPCTPPGFPARAELCLGLLQGGRADPAKITIRVMAITSLETRLP
jgi:hypothetical protein